MRKVYIANHPAEAHLLKGILESHGIHCEVQGEFLFSARGALPPTPETAPSVWIFDHRHFDAARAIVKEFETSAGHEASEGETWVCNACGEASEEQFTECWNCGTPRDFS